MALSFSNVAMSFLIVLAKSLLKSLWDSVWAKIFEAVVYAEEQWQEAGRGEAKKSWVMEQIMGYLDQRTSLSWLQRRVVELAVSSTIDGLIQAINTEFGHSWLHKVKGLEQELAKKWSLS